MTKRIGFNTVLIGTTVATPTTAHKIGLIRSIEGPSAERPAVDATVLGSTARQFLAGVLDGGEFTFELAWDPTGTTYHQWAPARLADGQTANFEVRLNPGTTTDAKLTFAGLVTGFAPTFPLDDLMTASVTVKVDGSITWPT